MSREVYLENKQIFAASSYFFFNLVKSSTFFLLNSGTLKPAPYFLLCNLNSFIEEMTWYCVCSEQGLTTRMMIKTCWNCERMFLGVNGSAPGSWKTIVTMSFPMWRFRSSCCRLFGVNGSSVDTWNWKSNPKINFQFVQIQFIHLEQFR